MKIELRIKITRKILFYNIIKFLEIKGYKNFKNLNFYFFGKIILFYFLAF
jgi:hypothetical protein